MGWHAHAMAILDVLDDVVITFSPEGVVEWASASLSTVLGHDPHDIVGTDYRIDGVAVPPTDLGKTELSVCTARADGLPLRLHVRIRPLPEADGEAGGWVVIAHDVTAQELADETLAASMPDQPADIIQRLDGHNRTIWISDSVEGMTGWPVEECLGETRFDRVHPRDTEQVADTMVAIRSGADRVRTVQVRLRQRSGTYQWWAVTARLIGDDPQAGDVVLTYRNVDAELQMGHEVRRQEALSSSILDAVLDPVVLTRPVWGGLGQVIDLVFTEVNQAATQIFAIERSALVGRSLTETVPEEVAVDLIAVCGQVRDSGRPIAVTDQPLGFRQTGSTQRRFDLRVWQVEDLVGITWREKTPMAGEDPEGHVLADTTADVVVRGDNAGRLEWISPSVTDILGWAVDDLVGKDFGSLVHPDDLPAVRVAQRGLINGARVRFRVRLRARDGHWHWIEASLRPLLDRDGEVIGRLGGWRDIQSEVQTREALDAERGRLRATFDAALDPFAFLQAVRATDGQIRDFVFVEANDAACSYNGLPRERLLATTVLDLIPGDAGTDLLARYASVVDTGEPLVLDAFPVDYSPDHVPRRLDIRGVKIGDGIALTWRDVTDRAEVAERVAASEARLALMLDTMSEGVVIHGADNRILEANRAARRILGLPGEAQARGFASPSYQLIRRDGSDLPPEEDPLNRVRSTGDPVRGAIIGLKPDDGATIWLQTSAEPLPVQGQTAHLVLSTFSDITDKVAADDLLRESERRFRMLAENASEVVVQTGADGRIVWISPSLETVLGFTPEEVIGRRVSELLHPGEAERLRAEMQQNIQTHREQGERRMRMATADGGYRWVSALGRALTDEEGTVIGGLDAMRDIQDQVEAQTRTVQAQARLQRLLDGMAEGVVVIDTDGVITECNPAARSILGSTEEDLIGRLVPGEGWPTLREDGTTMPPDEFAASIALRTGQSVRGSIMGFRRADATIVWLLVHSEVMTDPLTQAMTGVVTTFVDITGSVEAREELAAAHQRLELVLESSRLGLWDWNMITGETVYNERWAQILGYTLEELKPTTQQTWASLIHPSDRAISDEALQAHAQGLSAFYDVDCRMRHKDGQWVWVRDRGRIVEWDDQGRPSRMTGTHEDINVWKRASDALEASEERFRVAMASAPVGMAVLDLDRRIVQVNPALAAMLARTEEWLVGRDLSDVTDESDDLLDLSARSRLLDTSQQSITIEHRVRRGDKVRIWVQQSISLVHGAGGVVTGYVSQFSDITESVRARRRLRDLASRDPLTDLLNRRELAVRLEQLNAMAPEQPMALLFIDLDGLKQINDTHGHLVGDRVIQQQARRICRVVGGHDLVGRYGGDEFIVAAPQVHTVEQAQGMAQAIREATRMPIPVDGIVVEATCSIGIALTDPGADLEAVLARADAAVYRAKRAGRDRAVAFDPDVDDGTDPGNPPPPEGPQGD